MKALTIYQPWATLIMVGAKRFEFRKWDFRARGFSSLVGERIVIHAATRKIREAELLEIRARVEAGDPSLTAARALPLLNRAIVAVRAKENILTLSAGLGTAVLGAPVSAYDLFKGKVQDPSWIDQDVFAWPLSDIRAWQSPVECRGLQGFWNWPFRVTS